MNEAIAEIARMTTTKILELEKSQPFLKGTEL